MHAPASSRTPLFDVEVTGSAHRRRARFDRAEVTIGRVAADLILPAAGIERRHARLLARDGQVLVEDLGGAAGTRVNRSRLAAGAPTALAPADLVQIGSFSLRAEAVRPVVREPDALDPAEEALLAAIEDGDHTARLVYADWLEQRGDTARAELLRVQQQLAAMPPDDPARADTQAQLRALSLATDAPWRKRISRAALAPCGLDFDLLCPKEWSALAPTEAASVRFCGTCARHVFYCTDAETAREHAAHGRCVAIDAAAIRPAPPAPPPPAPQEPGSKQRVIAMGMVRIAIRSPDVRDRR